MADPQFDPSQPYEEVPDAGTVFKSVFPTAHINQELRPADSSLASKNPSSTHIADPSSGRTGFDTIDVRPSSIPGETFESVKQKIEAAGHKVVYAKDEVSNPSKHATGPHWHYQIEAGAPVFDPSKPFEVVDDKKAPTAAPTPEGDLLPDWMKQRQADPNDSLTTQLQQNPSEQQPDVNWMSLGEKGPGNSLVGRVGNALATPGLPDQYAAFDPMGMMHGISGAASVINAGMEALKGTPLEGLVMAFPDGPHGMGGSGVARLAPEIEAGWVHKLETGSREEILKYAEDNHFNTDPDKLDAWLLSGRGKKAEAVYQDPTLPESPEHAVRAPEGNLGHTETPPVESAPAAAPVEHPVAPDKYSAEEVQQHVTDTMGSWKNPPNVHILQDAEQLDPDMLNDLKDQGLENDVLGFHNEDGVTLIANNIDKDMLPSVTFHESLGHHGLAQMFGNHLDTVLHQMYESNPKLQGEVHDWNNDPTNHGAYDSYDDPLARQIEEVLAEKANDGVLSAPLRNKVVTIMKQYARKMGFKGLKYSDREIATTLAMSHDRVINGSRFSNSGIIMKPRFMVTYHGSPHDFDKFSTDHIGKGEGAQVYGHGLYFTETEGIAKGYRDRLSRNTTYEILGKQLPAGEGNKLAWHQFEQRFRPTKLDNSDAAYRQYNDTQQWFSDFLQQAEKGEEYKNWKEAAISAGVPEDTIEKFNRNNAQAAFNFVKSLKIKATKAGKLYEVDLPDDAKWLDWDKPVSEQPHLQDVLEKKGYKFVDRDEYRKILENEANADHPENAGLGDQFREDYTHAIGNWWDGSDVYSHLKDQFGAEQASKELADAGITGNRYLDGSSRGKGEGRYNYVVFQDKDVSVRNKYMMKRSRGRELLEAKKAARAAAAEAERVRQERLEAKRNRPAGNLNLNNIKATDRTKDFMKDIAMDAEPREPQSHLQTEEYARADRKTNDDVLAMPDVMKPEDMLKAREVEVRSATRGGNLQKRIDDGDTTPETMAKYVEAATAHGKLFDKMSEMRGDAGRLLNSLKIEAGHNPSTEIALMARAFETRGITEEALRNGEVTRQDVLDTMNDVRKAIASDHRVEAVKNIIPNIGNFSKAIRASIDLSAPLRQGLPLIGTKAWWTSLQPMVRAALSDKNYTKSWKEIQDNPLYAHMRRAGVAFTDIHGGLESREEAFMTDLAKKVPGVERSERAYVTFLNKLRADSFSSIVDDYHKADIHPDRKQMKEIATYVNNATGRGSLGKFDHAAATLNVGIFSPRLITSKLQMMNPVYFTRMDKPLRTRAVKNYLAFAGIMGTVYGLLAMNGVEVKNDWRDKKIGQIHVHNTWFDPTGGAGGYIHMLGSLLTQQYVGTDGTVKDYGTGYKDKTWGKDLLHFGRGKLSPLAGYAVTKEEGTDFVGKPYDPINDTVGMFVPMWLDTVNDIATTEGKENVLMALPDFFGVNTQSYSPDSRPWDKQPSGTLHLPMNEQVDMEGHISQQAPTPPHKTRGHKAPTFDPSQPFEVVK